MNTYTSFLSEYKYFDLLDLRTNLLKHYPDHPIIPWVEQEIELREAEFNLHDGDFQ
jgi:hypothetical protein